MAQLRSCTMPVRSAGRCVRMVWSHGGGRAGQRDHRMAGARADTHGRESGHTSVAVAELWASEDRVAPWVSDIARAGLRAGRAQNGAAAAVLAVLLRLPCPPRPVRHTIFGTQGATPPKLRQSLLSAAAFSFRFLPSRRRGFQCAGPLFAPH